MIFNIISIFYRMHLVNPTSLERQHTDPLCLAPLFLWVCVCVCVCRCLCLTHTLTHTHTNAFTTPSQHPPPPLVNNTVSHNVAISTPLIKPIISLAQMAPN